MKRFILKNLALIAGTMIITSSTIFLNSCTMKGQNNQSSSQAQTSQESNALEEQLQIENDTFEELQKTVTEVERISKQNVIKRDECKEHLEAALKSGNPSLIEESAKALRTWEKVVACDSKIYKDATDKLWETSEKIIILTKQLKNSQGI
jgi:thiamine phosphate synthase YjbQ (UPF0047 family)